MQTDAGAHRVGWQQWLLLLALIAAVFLVYQPAWQGELLWDDDAHVTRPELRSFDGLGQIWIKLGATQQYYPLLHSFFWLQHQLWGDATLGYHLVNIALHATAAVLAALVLRRLKIPGALLAAAIFALHPVQVESVAWITEQKNTLSAVFYLSAALVYLRFDQTRRGAGTVPFFAAGTVPFSVADEVTLPSGPAGGKGDGPLQVTPSCCSVYSAYGLALGLFVLALLSKTVTATLPAALLVVFWWQRGRLSWRRDALPLVPFFLLGAAAGMLTAWIERQGIPTEAEEFAFSLLDRSLIAGRVIWSYLGKLLWPAELLFIYPRWNVSQAVWWQYLFPIGVALLLAVLWAIRHRTRGPLAGLLFFAGTLFPVLGFLTVYPFRFSLVADHFQYLASLGVISLAAAGATLLWMRWNFWWRLVGQAICLVLLLVLAALSWQQSKMYADAERLYRATLTGNPACWMAHNNLGNALAGRGQIDEAIEHLNEALRLKPDVPIIYNDLGVALDAAGRFAEAVQRYEQSLRLLPDSPLVYNNLGHALTGAGKLNEAIEQYQLALRLQPDMLQAHHNLGLVLAELGRNDEAIEHFRRVVRLKPDDAAAHGNLANALAAAGRNDEAIEQFNEALRLKSDIAELHNNLGLALAGVGKADEALEHCRQAVRLKPDYIKARNNLAGLLAGLGRSGEAIEQYGEVLRLMPHSQTALAKLAWLLATRDPVEGGDPARAVQLAERAREVSGQGSAPCLDTLAAAYAAAGRFLDAIQSAQRALQLAESAGQTGLAKDIRSRLNLYRAGRPCRQGENARP